jgi:hypothetical protein
MPDVRISSSLAPLLLLAVVFVAVLLATFAYRNTVPPVAPRLKRTLIALRTLGLSFAFALLTEPILSFVHRSTEPPRTVVLVDNSQSLTLEDKSGSRANQLRSVVASADLQRLSTIGAIKAVSFDASAREVLTLSPDSFRLDGERTNISEAFAFAKHDPYENTQAIVLLTDGNATAGEDPAYVAEALGIPVFTVGVGDTSTPKDLSVRSILTNEIAYPGSTIPLNATVRSAGMSGERVEVILRSGGDILDRATITLEPGVRDYPISFTFKPEHEGIQQLIVEVSLLPGEATTRNNRKMVAVKVLKSQLRVLLIAGAPSADVSTVRHSLESDKDLKVQTFVERGGGQFYEGPVTESVITNNDCVVLVGFPGPSSPPQTILALLDQFQQGKPLLFILSRTIDTPRLKSLERALPVSVQQGSSNEFDAFLSLPESERSNVLFKINNAPSTIWSSLPPLLTTQAIFKVKPDGEILATKRLAVAPLTDPMIVWRNVNTLKSVAFLGYGLRRWTMHGEDGQHAVDQFLSNAVRWLTTRDDDRRIRVQPVKDVFLSSERALFSAQVYDDNLQPIDDAHVTVRVPSGSGEVAASLESLGSGQFEGGFDLLEAGNYTYAAEVVTGGKLLGRARGTFSVGGANVEFQETQMNWRVLELIAEKTGGTYFHATNLTGLANAVARMPRFQAREIVRSSEFALWNNEWSLAATLLCFALEWLLRKRASML